MDIKGIHILAVAAGSAAGGVCRYLPGIWVAQRWPHRAFLATLGVNVAGCFLMGLIFTVATAHHWASGARLLLLAGFCGGFTTFSAFSLECIRMLSENRYSAALLYAGASLAAGLLACGVGVALAQRFAA